MPNGRSRKCERPALNWNDEGSAERLHHDNPSMSPLLLSLMEWAAGTRGKPGIVMRSPQTAPMNSAPLASRTSRIGMVYPSGAPVRDGSAEKLYGVFAKQTGKSP